MTKDDPSGLITCDACQQQVDEELTVIDLPQVVILRANPKGQKVHSRLVKKHGKPKALGILAAKLGRALYFMLHRNAPFDLDRFVGA